jgi:nitrogen regulatory protein P-II 1
MTAREITVLTDVALITCIVQRGVADKIIQAAREVGAQGATVHYAKGMGIRERLGILGVAVDVEK